MYKVFFFVLVSILLSITTRAQQIKNDWGAFMQYIDAKPYAGKKFRLEAAVKVTLLDSTADAELWVRVDKENYKQGFFYNMMDKPIRSAEWKVYTIEGRIDKGGLQFIFGGLYHRRGKFYFDDFKLFIENDKKLMEEIPISNSSFEADSLGKWSFARKIKGFDLSVTDEFAFHGKRAYKVDGSALQVPKAYGSNSEAGKYIKANGIDIYYEEYGQGAPLLLLHGNSSSIGAFEKQIPELSKHFRVIAVDTRGQGRSSEDGKLYSYDLFADDMNALLDQLHLDSVNIVGWSDGGNTGLVMAMKYPAKVKRLVTMGANVFIDKTVVGKWVFKELDKQIKELKNDSSFYAKNRLRLAHMLLTEPRHSFAELASISCPVLVIAGEKDIIEEAHTKAIAQHIPNATLWIAPKETHYFPTEKPADFNKLVIDFIKK